jgi:hypothetical protein
MPSREEQKEQIRQTRLIREQRLRKNQRRWRRRQRRDDALTVLAGIGIVAGWIALNALGLALFVWVIDSHRAASDGRHRLSYPYHTSHNGAPI